MAIPAILEPLGTIQPLLSGWQWFVDNRQQTVGGSDGLEKHSNGCGVNAMRTYGYEDDLLYVGNWSFIEESSYQVLLESILDQEEQQQQQKKELAKEEAIYGSSSGSSALVCAGALNVALPTNEVEDPASQMDGISETSLVIHKSDDNVDTLVPPSVEGGSSQDINLDKSSEKRLTASPNANESKQPADGFPIRRRRPYHGFISNGQDEPELVDFGTPSHSEELQKVLFGRVVWKIHKTRWDLRPEDM
ncbi:uncharacterized protein LOC116111742 [Pistacia vera]|uniref:uncharacterized protein LOC116111742 n=1 Tax=Pistacia vera TaxID=55513 RepID=UPI001262B513|nr:uncharacterized protein LOC116111742 [Pistacia vera]